LADVLFPPWPNFSVLEAEAASRVLLSNRVNYWTGTECREFEKEFAHFCQVDYAIAVANGTLALELCLQALELGAGDEVIVTPRTFVASASAIIRVGAMPVFADVDPESQNITAATIDAVISSKTKAIICVHLAGWPCEMDEIMSLAENRGLLVIEDCAQAHGAIYKDRSVGSWGHMAAWSFCQDKIMTTGGEGGMVTTNDEELWRKTWAYKDHGKSYRAVYEQSHPEGFRWLHESFGSNYRMTEIQGAIGRLQLRKMEFWSNRRRTNAEAFDNFLRRFDILRIPKLPSYSVHARYKYYAFVKVERLAKGWGRDRIIAKINESGVPCFQGTCSEVYLEKAFEEGGFRPKQRLPIATQLGQTSIMFLVHPGITVEGHIKEAFKRIGPILDQAAGSCS